MDNYFITHKKKDCNGCGVCALKCPKKAITMMEDNEGFLYPVIDENKCVNCGLCMRICPNKDYPINDKVKTFVAINKNKKDLMRSSSGGCFIAIAKYIISMKGVVFGARYDNDLKVVHDYAESEKDLIKFQGSKYVRSDLKNSYSKVKEFLDDNRYVLFSGTPCQCQGLRTYLNKSYDKLYTCEIICHANPSPKVFEFYKRNKELEKNKKIVDIQFRSKSNGWRNQNPIIIYDDKEEEEEKIFFYKGFVVELFNRPSCHNCHFCSSNRLSDFTIGDAWGINMIDSTIKDDDTGISLLCINTDKGYSLKEYLSNNLMLREEDTNIAFSFNHNKNVLPHKNRDKFYKGISNNTINETNILKYINKYGSSNIFKKCIRKGKNIIKHLLKI